MYCNVLYCIVLYCIGLLVVTCTCMLLVSKKTFCDYIRDVWASLCTFMMLVFLPTLTTKVSLINVVQFWQNSIHFHLL